MAEVAEILRQAASGLHAAHKLGIIHRDVATHETFLILGITGLNFSGFAEVESVLNSYDPESHDGLKIRNVVRRALKEFVTEDEKHVQRIFEAAFKFCRLCDESIRKKHW